MSGQCLDLYNTLFRRDHSLRIRQTLMISIGEVV